MDPLTAGLAGAATTLVLVAAVVGVAAWLLPENRTPTVPRRELRRVVVDVLDNEEWSEDGDTRVWSAHVRHGYSNSCAVCQGETGRIADAVTDAVARLYEGEQNHG